MATQPTTQPEPKALARRRKADVAPVQADRMAWTEDQIALIQRTVAKGTTPDEFKLFLYQAQRSGLDPLAKQIYSVKRWSAKDQREIMAIQVGIDGFRVVADRTGRYAGSDDAVFSGADLVSGMSHKEAETLKAAATVTVYKIVGGIRCPFVATAHWLEYYPGERSGSMWRNKPHVMLAKVAEALALRKGFPADLSGLYAPEEMEASGEVIDVTPHVNAEPAYPVQAEPAPAPQPEDPYTYDTGTVDTEGKKIMSPFPGPYADEPSRKRLFGTAKQFGMDKEATYKVATKALGYKITSIRQIPISCIDDLVRAITGQPDPQPEEK